MVLTLEKVRLLDLLTPRQRKVITLEHNSSAADGFRVLSRHRILSAPLVLGAGLEDLIEEPSAPVGSSLMGWVGIDDLLASFLRDLRTKHPTLPTSMLALMALVEKDGKSFMDKMLITVGNGDEDRGLVFTVDAGASLLQTIREVFLVKRASGRAVHRLAIFNAHGEVTHVVSQFDVVRFLAQHPQLLGDMGERSLEDLGLLVGLARVSFVPATRPTLLALEEMMAVGLSGAPVLSPDGHVIANLSISDLRCIQPEHLGVLALPVAEFLALEHGTAYAGYSLRTSEPQVSTHPFFMRAATPGTSQRGASTSTQPSAAASGSSADAAGKVASAEEVAPTGQAPPEAVAAPSEAAASAGQSAPAVAGHASPRQAGPAPPELTGRCSRGDVTFVAVHRGAKLNEVLRMMMERHLHRVYVLDHEPSGDVVTPRADTVVGVVTPTDVLKLISTERHT